VGKKRHQCGALAKSISVCAASSVRDKKITHRQAFIDHHHHIKRVSVCAASSVRDKKITHKQAFIDHHHIKSISVCAASSVRANEVGSLKHELGSEVGSVVDIDRRTSINSMPMRPLRPSVRANENSSRS
jgi:hypothetical protein